MKSGALIFQLYLPQNVCLTKTENRHRAIFQKSLNHVQTTQKSVKSVKSESLNFHRKKKKKKKKPFILFLQKK